MTNKIRTGTMLIADGTNTPELLVIDTESYSVGWSSIMGSTSAQLGKNIENAGWTFFYMAGEIRTSGFGFSDQSRTARAVAHVIRAVRRENCNCLEITQVITGRSLLGLPYISLIAHARHIQKSRSFHDLSNLPARVGFRRREWPQRQTVPAQNQASSSSEAVGVWENEGGSRA
jgi:hypothetical protein